MGGQQDQHIDIGIRKQSTSAKAPHRDQTSMGGHTGFLPQGLQMRVAQVTEQLQVPMHPVRQFQALQLGALRQQVGFFLPKRGGGRVHQFSTWWF